MYGLAKNTVIKSGGEQNVYGTASGIVVNNDGVQSVTGSGGAYGVAIGTVLNAGALQMVTHGSSQGTIINKGATEDVAGGPFGYAQGSIISGGNADPGGQCHRTGQRPAEFRERHHFQGHRRLLDIGNTQTPLTTISGFAATDRIDLQGFGYNSGATVSLGKNNVLTITGLVGGTATLALDPKANYAKMAFTLASDGQSGTDLTVQAAPKAALAAPDLASLQAEATTAGDPLGQQATFTAAAAVTSAPAAGMIMPDVIGGSAHAASILAGAASASHVPLLSSHHAS